MTTSPGPIHDPELAGWLASHGWSGATAEPLPGDVSPRRYLRLVAAGRRAILALYPAELRPEYRRFERSSRLLAEAGVRVPDILARDPEERRMLVEDLGPRTVAELAPSRGRLERIFVEAAAVATRIAALPREPVAELNPALDAPLLRRELTLTLEAYLDPAGLVTDPTLRDPLCDAFDELCHRMAEPPLEPAHRDFMVRNLMPPPDGGPLAVIDHQGLRLAPPLYDLASLLNDTLFPSAAAESRLLAAQAPDAAARERYHRAAAQRTLKAVGSYAAFAARGHDRHAGLIQPTLARALGHLARLPETRDLAAELAPRWGAG